MMRYVNGSKFPVEGDSCVNMLLGRNGNHATYAEISFAKVLSWQKPPANLPFLRKPRARSSTKAVSDWLVRSDCQTNRCSPWPAPSRLTFRAHRNRPSNRNAASIPSRENHPKETIRRTADRGTRRIPLACIRSRPTSPRLGASAIADFSSAIRKPTEIQEITSGTW